MFSGVRATGPTPGPFRASLIFTGVLICGAAGCQLDRSAGPVHVEVQDWPGGGANGKQILTDHWDIRTTIRDTEFHKLLPEFMESTYHQYTKLFPNMQTSDSRRLQVYLFQSRREWEAFSAKRFPRKARLYRRIRQGAYCEGDLCVAYYIRRVYTLSVLAHEGLHAFVHRHFAGTLPAWLNEGLATYCEGYEYGVESPKFTPDRNEFRLNSLRAALLGDQLVPLRELLRTHAGEVVRGTSPGVYAYYSQAWALIVYLRHGEKGKYAREFESLLQDLGTERMRVGVGAYVAATRTEDGSPMSFGEAVFRKYISEDLDTFERQYKKYLYEVTSLR